jgi:hypothetical protein
MGIFSFFQPKGSLKSKIQIIEGEMKHILSINLEEKFSLFHYGAFEIDPRHLVFWICIDTDEIKQKLEENKELNSQLRNILIKNKYPEKAIPNIHIGFESQETVDRESKGDWWVHFK